MIVRSRDAARRNLVNPSIRPDRAGHDAAAGTAAAYVIMLAASLPGAGCRAPDLMPACTMPPTPDARPSRRTRADHDMCRRWA